MISLSGIVWIVLYLLIAAAVLGMLWFLINFVEAQMGGPAKVYAVIRVIFVVLVVLLLIFLLLSFLSGQPLLRA